MDLSADERQYSMKIREMMAKFANIAEMGISAGQYRYSVKLIAKLWKPVHIAKMGPSATQYLIKTIEQMCKLNVVIP